MLSAPTKHFTPRVRNLCQENDYGRIFSLVHLVYPLLASGVAGNRFVSRRLVDHFAVSHRGHRGARRFCSALRAFFPSRAGFARSASNLTARIPLKQG